MGVAIEVRGRGSGRLRLQVLPDPSSGSLLALTKTTTAPGAIVHTDGYQAYNVLTDHGYDHRRRPNGALRPASTCSPARIAQSRTSRRGFTALTAASAPSTCPFISTSSSSATTAAALPWPASKRCSGSGLPTSHSPTAKSSTEPPDTYLERTRYTLAKLRILRQPQTAATGVEPQAHYPHHRAAFKLRAEADPDGAAGARDPRLAIRRGRTRQSRRRSRNQRAAKRARVRGVLQTPATIEHPRSPGPLAYSSAPHPHQGYLDIGPDGVTRVRWSCPRSSSGLFAVGSFPRAIVGEAGPRGKSKVEHRDAASSALQQVSVHQARVPGRAARGGIRATCPRVDARDSPRGPDRAHRFAPPGRRCSGTPRSALVDRAHIVCTFASDKHSRVRCTIPRAPG